jgi:hypothetical protein
MRYPLIEQIRRSRAVTSFAALVVVLGVVLAGGPVQARIDLGNSTGFSVVTLDANSVAKATGGGTILAKPFYPSTVGSFGFNARRPVNFPGGGAAEGRINYDRHKNMTDRHVNAPVIYMEAAPTPAPPNNTGGDALMSADCTGGSGAAQCPALTRAGSAVQSVVVYVKDVSDSGAGSDIFNIYFCSVPAGPPTGFVPGGALGGCDGPEGAPDTIRSGNIQVRAEAGISGESIGTGAGSGAYTSTPNINGVELSGGTFGIGLRTAGPGDLEANLNGVQPLIGLFQQLTVTGWVTTASNSGGTMTFSGNASLDMGDGAPPLSGLALSGSMTATGLTLTVGSWSFGTLPVQDGAIKIE